jgi:hypothetical protein
MQTNEKTTLTAPVNVNFQMKGAAKAISEGDVAGLKNALAKI